MNTYTCYCSMPDTPRGSYDEEIDVEAKNPSDARRKAEQIIAEGYDPGLHVRKVRRIIPEVYIFSL